MRLAEQGDLLKVAGIAHPMLVVSNNFFNESGRVIACPVLQGAVGGRLHIPLKEGPVEGWGRCEERTYLDPQA